MNLFSQGKTKNWNKIGIKVEYETARKDKKIGVRWKVTWTIDKGYFYGYNIITNILMQGQTKANLIVKNSMPNRGSGKAYFPSKNDYYWFEDGYADNVIENCRLTFHSTNGGDATYSTATASEPYKNITAPVGYMASTVVSDLNFNVGNNLQINIKDLTNQNYNYELYFNLQTEDNGWANLAVITTTNKVFTWNASEETEYIQTLMPTRNRTIIECVLITKIGSNIIGTTVKTGTITIVNAEPLANTFSFFDTRGIFPQQFEIVKETDPMLAGISILQVDIPVPETTENKGATLTKYTLEVGDYAQDISYSENPISIILPRIALGNDVKKITLYTVDSRGNKANISKDITVVPYHDPYITECELKRQDGIEKTVIANIRGKMSIFNIPHQPNMVPDVNALLNMKYEIRNKDDEMIGNFKYINANKFTVDEEGNFSATTEIEGDLGAEGFTQDTSFKVIFYPRDSISPIDSTMEYRNFFEGSVNTGDWVRRVTRDYVDYNRELRVFGSPVCFYEVIE